MLTNEEVLLKLISCNNDTEILINKGLTYSQISLLLQQCIDKGYVSIDRFELNLTTEGKAILKSAEKENNIKYGMLLPQEKYYQKPISKDKIILPKKI